MIQIRGIIIKIDTINFPKTLTAIGNLYQKPFLELFFIIFCFYILKKSFKIHKIVYISQKNRKKEKIRSFSLSIPIVNICGGKVFEPPPVFHQYTSPSHKGRACAKRALSSPVHRPIYVYAVNVEPRKRKHLCRGFFLVEARRG